MDPSDQVDQDHMQMLDHPCGQWMHECEQLRAQLSEATQQHCQRIAELKGKIESAQSDCARFVAELEANELQLAEANRKVRVLREACETFVEWLRREDEGFCNAENERGTIGGEAKWREWFNENLRICDLAQTQARKALTETQEAGK